jgi:hypothetical protein
VSPPSWHLSAVKMFKYRDGSMHQIQNHFWSGLDQSFVSLYQNLDGHLNEAS